MGRFIFNTIVAMSFLLVSLAGVRASAESTEETWLDRESVGYFASGLKASNPALAQAILGALQGVQLQRDSGGLTVSAFFKDEVWVQTISAKEAAPGHVYRIEIPKILRLRVEMGDGLVRVSVLDAGRKGLRLKAKIPLMPDSVYVHGLEANLATGELRFKAGVMADWLIAVAVSSIAEPLKGRVDIAATILETLPFLKWQAIEKETPTLPAALRLPGPELPELREWKFNEITNAP